MESLFRGKHLKNGEWITGQLLYGFLDNTGEIATKNPFIQIEVEGGFKSFPVNIETIGQYSYRKDINHKEIFTGDKIKVFCDSYSDKLGIAKGEWICEVLFDVNASKYVLKSIDKPSLMWNFDSRDFNGHYFKKEIIGTIYD